MHLDAIDPVDEIASSPFHRVLVVLIEAGFGIDTQRPPIPITVTDVFDGTGCELVGSVVTVMFKNIDFTGARLRPADILVRLLHGWFIVAGAKQSPRGEHAGLTIALQPQSRGPLALYKLLAILGYDTAGHIAGVRVLLTLLVKNVTDAFLPDIYDLQF